jgi:hypothetical protein
MQKLNLVLRHYNKLKPINCTVVSGDTNKLFTVKFDDNEGSETEIIKGDPILIGILRGEEDLQVNGGCVVGATPQEDKYIIASNEVIQIPSNLDKREFERYPTSILADIKSIETNIRESACIKDISFSGMCIYSTGEYNIDDPVEVTLYLSNNVAKYDGSVVRKSRTYGRNEYGIQILHRDKNAMYSTQNQLANLMQNERELMYRHLLSANFKI